MAEVESKEAVGTSSDIFNIKSSLAEMSGEVISAREKLTYRSYMIVFLIFIFLILTVILIKYKFKKINDQVNDYIHKRFKSE